MQFLHAFPGGKDRVFALFVKAPGRAQADWETRKWGGPEGSWWAAVWTLTPLSSHSRASRARPWAPGSGSLPLAQRAAGLGRGEGRCSADPEETKADCFRDYSSRAPARWCPFFIADKSIFQGINFACRSRLLSTHNPSYFPICNFSVSECFKFPMNYFIKRSFSLPE